MTLSLLSHASYSMLGYVRDHAPILATPHQMLRNAERIIPVAIPLIAASMVPGADGGPWFACLCIAACVPLAEVPPLFAACLAACGVALATPTP